MLSAMFNWLFLAVLSLALSVLVLLAHYQLKDSIKRDTAIHLKSFETMWVTSKYQNMIEIEKAVGLDSGLSTKQPASFEELMALQKLLTEQLFKVPLRN